MRKSHYTNVLLSKGCSKYDGFMKLVETREKVLDICVNMWYNYKKTKRRLVLWK